MIDPDQEVFEHKLYQNGCYVFEKNDEKIFYMLKDISRFVKNDASGNRDIKRSVLLDPNPLNFMLTPENGMPFMAYTAELHTGVGEKDEYLMGMQGYIDELIKQ